MVLLRFYMLGGEIHVFVGRVVFYLVIGSVYLLVVLGASFSFLYIGLVTIFTYIMLIFDIYIYIYMMYVFFTYLYMGCFFSIFICMFLYVRNLYFCFTHDVLMSFFLSVSERQVMKVYHVVNSFLAKFFKSL